MKKILSIALLILISRVYGIPSHSLCYYQDNSPYCDKEPLGWFHEGVDLSIYKILKVHEWERFKDQGFFEGSEHDLRDGFIHLAKANEQLDHVLSKYFSGQEVVIIEMEVDQLGENLKWENAYPHLYHIPLRMKDVKRFSYYQVREKGH